MFVIDTANFARQLLPPIYDDQLRNGALEKLLLFFLNKIAPMIKQIGDTRDLGLVGYGIQNKRLVEAILSLYGITLFVTEVKDEDGKILYYTLSTTIIGNQINISQFNESLEVRQDDLMERVVVDGKEVEMRVDVAKYLRQLNTIIRRDFSKITPQGIPITLKITA